MTHASVLLSSTEKYRSWGQHRVVCFAFRNNSNIRSRLKKESTWRDPQELTQFLKLQWAISYAVFCLKKKSGSAQDHSYRCHSNAYSSATPPSDHAQRDVNPPVSCVNDC